MAPTVKYERLATTPSPPHSPSSSRSSLSYPPPYDAHLTPGDVEHEAVTRRPVRRREPIPALDSDPRFRRREVSPYARAALIIFMLFLFWLAFAMRKALWLAGIEHNTNKPPPEVDASY